MSFFIFLHAFVGAVTAAAFLGLHWMPFPPLWIWVGKMIVLLVAGIAILLILGRHKGWNFSSAWKCPSARLISRRSRLTAGSKRGEVYAERRGELFGIFEFVKRQESPRLDEVMSTVKASPPHPLHHKSITVLI